MTTTTDRARLPLLLAPILAMLVASPALASKKTAMRTYFGVAVSSDSTDYKDPDFFSGDVDDSAGYSFWAGFPILPYLAAEVGYTKIGDADFDGEWQGFPDTGTIKADGIRASVLGAIPIGNRFSVFGRVGMFAWNVDENEIFDGVPESYSESGTDLVYGAGVQVMLTKKLLDLRAEWVRSEGVGEFGEGTGSGDTDSFSVGLIFRLRGPYFGTKRENIEP